ncbi:MAG: hemolysin family protein [Candidatus Omnitrophica bacterium]|nr:hemolysin family protein [Candidatus Omnitrophota bacterium]MDD5352979.1 hemolysin family protein [Candidatus Omnitrophota bacterium]MDD5550578.1 hemolysin family protein [Candidatus Omnitrophota bacterium]
MLQDIILLAILLFFSALFSGSETALVSLDSIKLKRIQKQNKDTKYLQGLLSNPTRFLTTILVGNTLVNITLSTILTSILIKTLGDKGLAVSIGVATGLLLIFGEITPKIFAIKKPEDFAYNIARPLEIFTRIIFPLRFVFNGASDMFIKAIGVHLTKEPTLTQEELKSVIEVSHRHGVVKENEKEMIRSVLELTQTSVQEIMTPRPDIKALSLDSFQEEALKFLQNIKHSKIPVYKDNRDNITGVLYSKDLFFFPEKDFKTMIKNVLFVPATKKIDELLKDFQKQNSKVAIVVDEYGNTYGLVTFEDILEEIVGEIYDEFETAEKFVEKINDKTFRVSGKTPVYLVNDELDTNIPSGDYDTIAGYMLFLFKNIPQEAESIKKGNLSFRIEKLAGRRIKYIILEKL